MIEGMAGGAEEMFHRMSRHSVLPPEARNSGPGLDHDEVLDLLPHRDPFLFISTVTKLDLDQRIVVARYSLSQSAGIFDGHFPGRPVWPGVLHVEAIGQAGILLARLISRPLDASTSGRVAVSLTHIESARFRRPIGREGYVEIVACLLDEEDPFQTIVGQCLYEDIVCSAAVCACLIEVDDR